MFDVNKSIQIFGTYYNNREISILCDEKINDNTIALWEKNIYFFIRDWFSEANEISVVTSGSTGTPKLIKHQKKNMVASAKATLKFFNLDSGNVAWLCIPVKYIAGKMMVVRAIVGGLNLVYSEPNSIPHISSNVDFTAMVPNQVFELLQSKSGIDVFRNVKQLLVGGSSISCELEKTLLKHKVAAWHSYAMTETITHIALRKIGNSGYMGDFYPLKGVDLKLDKRKRLIIDYTSIGVSKLITNDIAKIYEDGSFTILGRSDNVIVSGGIKISPEIIESVIGEFLSNDFFIGGIPDDKLGEKVILFIEGCTSDYSNTNIEELVKGLLNKYELPKETVFITKFTRTVSGKIMRKANIDKYLISL